MHDSADLFDFLLSYGRTRKDMGYDLVYHTRCWYCRHFHRGSIEYGNELPDECAVAAQKYLDGDMTEEQSLEYEQKLFDLAFEGACPFRERKGS